MASFHVLLVVAGVFTLLANKSFFASVNHRMDQETVRFTIRKITFLIHEHLNFYQSVFKVIHELYIFCLTLMSAVSEKICTKGAERYVQK